MTRLVTLLAMLYLLSFEVACFPEYGLEGKSVLNAADAALYRAKQQGRDRVVVA